MRRVERVSTGSLTLEEGVVLLLSDTHKRLVLS